MIDWDAHYDAIYTALGISAELTIGSADPETVTVIDKTEGIDIEAAGTVMPTIKPGACIRASELAAKGIERAMLKGSTLVIGDYTWRIALTKPRPGAAGKGSGELLMILEEADA